MKNELGGFKCNTAGIKGLGGGESQWNEQFFNKGGGGLNPSASYVEAKQ